MNIGESEIWRVKFLLLHLQSMIVILAWYFVQKGLKKKDVCLLFFDWPKLLVNKGQLFLFFLIFYFQFCIFKQKC